MIDDLPKIVSLVVTGCVVLTSAAAYVFAKYRFWGKEQLFIVILSTMMVPFAVVLVPLYVTIADIGLSNKLGGVIVPVLFSTFGIFLMRQFLEGVPSDLIDAVRIDGASEWWIFSRIIIPLSTAPMAALAVFTFLFNWDNFRWPLVVLTSPQSQTLPLVLAGLRSLYWERYDMVGGRLDADRGTGHAALRRGAKTVHSRHYHDRPEGLGGRVEDRETRDRLV